LGHGIGDAVIGVFEALAQVAGAIVDGEEGGLVEPEIFFCYNAVHLLGDAPAEGIVVILDQVEIPGTVYLLLTPNNMD
jgi:hypothetical protein